MDNVFIYYVQLPDGVDEAVMPCLDGYTIYINSRLSPDGMIRAYDHAIDHIRNNDFEKLDVTEIEAEADWREK